MMLHFMTQATLQDRPLCSSNSQRHVLRFTDCTDYFTDRYRSRRFRAGGLEIKDYATSYLQLKHNFFYYGLINLKADVGVAPMSSARRYSAT